MLPIIILLIASYARAEEAGSSVVSGATKRPQPAISAPASVTVITSQEIRAFGWLTVEEAIGHARRISQRAEFLSSVPDVSFSAMRFPDISSRSLVLLNGRKINDGVYGLADMGVGFDVSIEDIERIEVIKGPGSALYGSGAMISIINVVTKRGREVGGIRASGLAASFDTYGAGLAYGGGSGADKAGEGGNDFLFSADLYRTRGRDITFREFGAVDRGLSDGADRGRYSRMFWSMSTSGGVSFGAGHLDGHEAIPTAPFGSLFNVDNTKAFISKEFVDFGYRTPLSEGRGLSLRLYYDKFKWQRDVLAGFDSLLNQVRSPSQATVTDLVSTRASDESYGTEVIYNEPWLRRHFLTVGYEYQSHRDADINSWDRLFLPEANVGAEYHAWGLFVQDEYKAERLALTLGYRYDEYDNAYGRSPRVAAVYMMGDETALKLIYGEAFRAPSVLERSYADGVTFKANPLLEPEEIRAYEAAIEHGLGAGFRGSVSYYRSDLSGLITLFQDTDGLYQHRNLQDAEAEGVEAEISLLKESFSGRVSYSMGKAVDTPTGRRLPDTPKRSARAAFAVPFWGGFSAGAQVDYAGTRRTLTGAHIPRQYVTNLVLSRQKRKGLGISAGVYNILDTSHSRPALVHDFPVERIEGPGRTFRVRASYTF